MDNCSTCNSSIFLCLTMEVFKSITNQTLVRNTPRLLTFVMLYGRISRQGCMQCLRCGHGCESLPHALVGCKRSTTVPDADWSGIVSSCRISSQAYKTMSKVKFHIFWMIMGDGLTTRNQSEIPLTNLHLKFVKLNKYLGIV